MHLTGELLKKISPAADGRVDRLAEGMNRHLPVYGMTDLGEVQMFLAQAAHESAGFSTMYEYWGPTPAQRRYEGRKDLGNVQAGDGFRYRGRGIFQLTGRANYRIYGAALGLPLEINPEIAADPFHAVRIACEYWKRHKIGAVARRGDFVAVTRLINGGTNGIEDRRRLFDRCRKFVIKEMVA